MSRFALYLATIAVLLVPTLAARLQPIIGGSRASRSTYRHVALVVIQTRHSIFACTGSVIGRRWILTAAHCVDDKGRAEDIIPSRSYVYVDQRALYPDDNAPFYNVKRVYTHKSYLPTRSNFAHDVALIELAKKIRPQNYSPVALAAPPPSKTRVVAAGFGVIDNTGREPTVVMQVSLMSQSLATCRATEHPSFRSQIRDNLHVCASALGFPNRGGQDTCSGDSGGPLFRTIKGMYHQYGITSFGPEDCAERGTVAYYTKVSSYKRHLIKIMRTNSASHTRFKIFA